MDKFDKSCGLTKKQIDHIKFAARHAAFKRLPTLPEPIETALFLQGRDAWVFRWGLCGQPSIGDVISVSLEIVVKLKKEFRSYNVRLCYKFLCRVQLGKDIYNPKVSLREVAA